MSDKTITWFRTSPDAGPDCICSLCGEPILESDVGPIRAWDDEAPDLELRFHYACFKEVEKNPKAYTAVAAERACRECGCTDSWGCPEGCYWVEADLCSSCAEPPPDFTAYLNKSEGERVAAWQYVFDGAAVPLRSPIAQLAKLPDREPELVYMLDIEALTAEQRGRLVEHIADKFSISAEEVERDLDTEGCPVLAEHVIVSIANPQRWL